MRLPLRVVEGKAAPIDPRTGQQVPREPRSYPHISYWLARVRDGTMEAVDVSKLSDGERRAFAGGELDDTAAEPRHDTAIRTRGREGKGGRTA